MRPRRPNAARERRSILKAALLCLCLFAAAAAPCARAWVAAPRPAGAAQTPAPAPKDLGQVRPGETRRQPLEGGEAHAYRVTLARGQYLRAVVEQDGVDLTVSFYEPGADPSAAGAKPVVSMDTLNGSHGPESVSLVAEASGEYLLVARSEERGAAPGRYELRLEDAREPTEADLLRVRAEAAYVEGRRLRRLGTNEYGKQAVAKYAEALGLWRTLGDRYGEACTLYALGRTYHVGRGQLDAERTNFDAALDSMNRALAVFRELDDLFGQAMVNDNIGDAERDLDTPRNALPFYERAYDLYERADDRRGKALEQSNIGLAHAGLGDYREALRHYEQSLPICQAARDRNMEANAYNHIANALENLGDPTRALAMYRQALGIWQETGNIRLAAAYNNVGAVYHRFGDTQAALENYATALALQREQKAAAGEANTLNNIGMTYAEMGDTDRALEYFNQSLALYQSLGQKRGQADALDNLGYAHYLLNSYDEALARYEQALALYEQVGDKQRESYVLTHIGMLHAARGDAPKALARYERAKKIQQDGGMKLGLAVTLDKIANAQASAGDATRAAETFGEALALWADVGAERGRAASLYGLARVESARGDLDAARKLIGKAIEAVESLRARTTHPQLKTTLLASKYDYYELDVDVKMRLGAQSTPAALAELTDAAFESSEQARARGLLDMLSESQADVRAWVRPELAAKEGELKRRLCALSDRVLSQREALGRAQAAAKAADKAGAARLELRLQALRGEIENLKREYDALSAEYDDVRASIRSHSPRYAQLTQPAPPKASSLKALLDPDTLLLEYSLGEERSYLWAVTRERVEAHTLPGRARIRRAAEALMESVATYGSRKPGEGERQYLERLGESPRLYALAASELGRVLLGPVAGRLGSKRVVVVADGALQFIPFEALFAPAETAARRAASEDADAQPLGMTNEVVYLPSASTLALLRSSPRARAGSKNVAVFADPVFNADDDRVAAADRRAAPTAHAAPKLAALGRALRDFDPAGGEVRLERLRYTLDEAEAIMSVAPAGSAMKATAFMASRANATSPSVGGYRVVHFATHALLDDRRPELSGLVMSLVDERGRPQDGFLRLGDIYNLKLPVDLVVLSACRTGIGKEVRGEGLVGLHLGFMYAGASRVVSSLWKVDDEATAALMKSFYRHMLKEGRPAAAALRMAKSELRQARAEWRAPYFWAGFVLQGDWRPSQFDRATPKYTTASGTH
ncbi:MAG TPA: CHAT domain-containing tetratricopeptide repeat protein [Pyrinomonadaceae bacterium]|nr:CHAT domain-containing tetratricopeptide repeat protein [Pyrinomonadaceae bacterium]